MLAAGDSMSGCRPCLWIASLVVGPIEASSEPSETKLVVSKKLSTVDALVNVTTSMSRNSSAFVQQTPFDTQPPDAHPRRGASLRSGIFRSPRRHRENRPCKKE